MRDALSLLDQCASATVGELSAQRVYDCLGIAGERTCGQMMGYVADHNTKAALELFNRLYADGKEVGALLDELICLCRDLMVLKTAPNSGISMLNTKAALELFNRLYADGKEVGALLDELICLCRDLMVLKTAPNSGISMLSGVASLELFNRLYADGKEVGALLDELICLCRDLMVLKTAPNSGISMLSGVASDEQSKDLARRFSSGELIYMIGVLQQTVAGFTRSASRRMDAEMCLMNLCEPSLRLDAQSLNARLGRVEEQLRAGVVVFTRSASRRMDAEMCLMNLCEPSLRLDAQSLNARLGRVEEQLRAGVVVRSEMPGCRDVPDEPVRAVTSIGCPVPQCPAWQSGGAAQSRRCGSV